MEIQSKTFNLTQLIMLETIENAFKSIEKLTFIQKTKESQHNLKKLYLSREEIQLKQEMKSQLIHLSIISKNNLKYGKMKSCDHQLAIIQQFRKEVLGLYNKHLALDFRLKMQLQVYIDNIEILLISGHNPENNFMIMDDETIENLPNHLQTMLKNGETDLPKKTYENYEDQIVSKINYTMIIRLFFGIMHILYAYFIRMITIKTVKTKPKRQNQLCQTSRNACLRPIQFKKPRNHSSLGVEKNIKNRKKSNLKQKKNFFIRKSCSPQILTRQVSKI